MITTKDKIGYIRRQENPDGTTTFKLIEAKIKSVRIGKKGTSVYSDRFRALDAEELEENAELMADTSRVILVDEPFVMNDEMSERLKNVVEHWNKHGAETLLGNRTEPPKKDGWYQVYAPSYSGGSSSGLKNINGNMYSAFKHGKWSIEVGYHKRPGCVKAWMPLPEPPKEEA